MVWCSPSLLLFSSCSERRDGNLGGITFKSRAGGVIPPSHSSHEAKSLYSGEKKNLLRCDVPLLEEQKGSNQGCFFTQKSPPRTHRPGSVTGNCNTTPSANHCTQRYHEGLCTGISGRSRCFLLCRPREKVRSGFSRKKPLTAMLSLMVCPSLKPRSSLGP